MMQTVHKFLITGNSDTFYIRSFIEYVLVPLGYDIYVQQDTKGFVEFYDKYNVHFIKTAPKRFIFALPKIGTVLRFILNTYYLLRARPFEFIHIQFVTKRLLKQALFIKTENTKVVASFWGSDLLRQKKKYLFSELDMLNKLDFISGDAYILQDKYNEIFPSAKNALNVIYYGVTLFPYIDKCLLTKDTLKPELGISKDKIIVSIGYNAGWFQQHDKVIRSLMTLSQKEKNRYVLFLQLYAARTDETYFASLLKMLEISGFEYRIYDKYISNDDMAKLRVVTDIFINAQTTDAFCNTIKEYMYAYTHIINASWLHYPEIDKFGLNVFEFKSFSEIPALLDSRLSDRELESNRAIIAKEGSWDTCREKWTAVYCRKDQ
ncbi:glycosyltransferase [Treponema denticola]|uniref:glycosyltransferase n=1 Tax=Treponema denticola TaxID=158 RepID=UPI0021069864|nr:glycosyltransferase [Treponema denticola]